MFKNAQYNEILFSLLKMEKKQKNEKWRELLPWINGPVPSEKCTFITADEI